jgi:hypothetical protein
VREEGDLAILREDGKTIYQMYHFSSYGWQLEKLDRQIAQIGGICAILPEGDEL